jgi:(R,R)-butanediol dehydrogenase/meso-butanediol dehydrogenase/diacetyl reductase
MLHKLPPEIPLDYAAVIEPLSIVWHAIKTSGVTNWADQSVLVLGGGPIGFALLLCLRAIGASKVIVSEPTETRRQQVAEFATRVANPITEDVVGICKDLTSGEGVDVVFDCAGVQNALDAGFKAAKFEGLYLMVAVWEKPMVVPNWDLLQKHITLRGTFIIGDGKSNRSSCGTGYL